MKVAPALLHINISKELVEFNYKLWLYLYIDTHGIYQHVQIEV